MSDQCKNCTLRGNVDECESVDCTHHDSWYVKQQAARIAELEKALIEIEGIPVQNRFTQSGKLVNGIINKALFPQPPQGESK